MIWSLELEEIESKNGNICYKERLRTLGEDLYKTRLDWCCPKKELDHTFEDICSHRAELAGATALVIICEDGTQTARECFFAIISMAA